MLLAVAGGMRESVIGVSVAYGCRVSHARVSGQAPVSEDTRVSCSVWFFEISRRNQPPPPCTRERRGVGLRAGSTARRRRAAGRVVWVRGLSRAARGRRRPHARCLAPEAHVTRADPGRARGAHRATRTDSDRGWAGVAVGGAARGRVSAGS